MAIRDWLQNHGILSGGGSAKGNFPDLDVSNCVPPADHPLNYHSLSQEELMACFSSDWGRMDNDQKEALLEEVSGRYIKERGMNAPMVVIDDNMGSKEMGGYYGNELIKLNPDYLNNPYEALDTIIHETNHYIQDKNIAAGSGDTPDNLALYSCEYSKHGYGEAPESDDEPDYADKFRYYEMQSLEADSNNAGFDYVTANHDAFKKDPTYQNYLNGRRNYFGNLKSAYEADPDKWRQMELDHIEAARRDGVDDAICDRARRVIENGPDEAKQKAIDRAETVGLLHRDCTVENLASSADQGHQQYEQLRDNPNATPRQMQKVYLENEAKLEAINSALSTVNNNLANNKAAMARMHAAHNGEPGWGPNDDPGSVNKNYAKLEARDRAFNDWKDSLTAGRNKLEGDNESLKNQYAEDHGRGITDPIPASELRGREAFVDRIQATPSETNNPAGSFAAGNAAANAAQDGAPEPPERELDHPRTLSDDDSRFCRIASDGGQENSSVKETVAQESAFAEGKENPGQGVDEPEGEEEPKQGMDEPEGEEEPKQGMDEPEGEEKPKQGIDEPKGEEEPSQSIDEPNGEEDPVQGMDEPKGEEEPSQGIDEPNGEEDPVQGMDEPKGEEGPSQGIDEPNGEEDPVQGMDEPKGEEEPSQGMDEPKGEEEPERDIDEPGDEEKAGQGMKEAKDEGGPDQSMDDPKSGEESDQGMDKPGNEKQDVNETGDGIRDNAEDSEAEISDEKVNGIRNTPEEASNQRGTADEEADGIHDVQGENAGMDTDEGIADAPAAEESPADSAISETPAQEADGGESADGISGSDSGASDSRGPSEGMSE